MKFATPLTLALVITSRIGSADADAERTKANGLIDLEVGWNEKVRGLPMLKLESFLVSRSKLLLCHVISFEIHIPYPAIPTQPLFELHNNNSRSIFHSL